MSQFAFLREHQDHGMIAKLRQNQPLTADDIRDIEQLLITNCLADPDKAMFSKLKGATFEVVFNGGLLAKGPQRHRCSGSRQ